MRIIGLCCVLLCSYSLQAKEIYRSGYCKGDNISFTLSEDAFMVAFPDLDGDVKMRFEQMVILTKNGKEDFVYLTKGSHTFTRKGYYILKFIPASDLDTLVSFIIN